MKGSLDKAGLVPPNTSIMDTITTDLFLTAWDYNNRSPRWFNKKSYVEDTKANDKTFGHDMSLNNMVLASASTPFYFKPAVIDGDAYISGDNLCISPAMYAGFHIGPTAGDANLRIVSIGSTFGLPDLISADGGGSLITWSTRLATLTAPVKMHTMDGIINSLLMKHNHVLHKFEIPKSSENEADFYALSSDRLPYLKVLAEEMIDNNLDDINHIIDVIVTEKFSSLYSC